MIATLRKRVREALPGNIDKKLADALAEVGRLNKRRDDIRAELFRRCDWSYFDSRVKAAASAYNQQPTPENLEALIMSEFCLERAQERLAPLKRAFSCGNAEHAQFACEFPAWRETLATACELKLQFARAEAQRVTAEETERLGSGFDADEIQNSPVVRRAANTVSQCEYRLKAIQTEVPEACWSYHAGAVLDDA